MSLGVGLVHALGRMKLGVGGVSATASGATITISPAITAGTATGAGAFSNFATDTHILNGVAATYGDIWVEDAINWGPLTATFDANGMTGVGGPAMAGAVAADYAAGCTFVINIVVPVTNSDPAHLLQVDFFEPDFDPEVGFAVGPGSIDAFVQNWVSSVSTVAQVLSTGAHRLAVTITGTKLSLSVDGGAFVTAAHVVTAAPTIIGLSPAGFHIKTIAFYTARPDADLPGLST